jgi:hypothetical protein
MICMHVYKTYAAACCTAMSDADAVLEVHKLTSCSNGLESSTQSGKENHNVLELCRAHTPRTRCVCIRMYLHREACVCSWRPLPMYCARLCAWAESTWPAVAFAHAMLVHGPQGSKQILILNEARFSTTSMDLLYLLVAQMPRYPDMAIFVVTGRRTEPITLPLAHGRALYIIY